MLHCRPIITTAAIASLLAAGCGVSPASAPSLRGLDRVVAPRHDVPASGRVRRVVLLGHSVEHRPIRVRELGESFAGRRVLIVGCIHGNERAGISVARSLEAMSPSRGVDLWVLDDLNPDGVAADTRQNARGVDLNRNFPYGWRPAGEPGDQQYPGPRSLSEPEARIAYRLILRLHPQITIFFHQPLGLIDESGGDPRVERRFAQLTGLPLRRLTRYPGSAVEWQNHRLPLSTALWSSYHQDTSRHRTPLGLRRRSWRWRMVSRPRKGDPRVHPSADPVVGIASPSASGSEEYPHRERFVAPANLVKRAHGIPPSGDRDVS